MCLCVFDRVVRGLQERGFHLAHWEPNYRLPKYVTLAGLTFHLYSETLWVNSGASALKNEPVTRPSVLRLLPNPRSSLMVE